MAAVCEGPRTIQERRSAVTRRAWQFIHRLDAAGVATAGRGVWKLAQERAAREIARESPCEVDLAEVAALLDGMIAEPPPPAKA